MRCNYKALSAISLKTIPSLPVIWISLPIRVLWCASADFWLLLEMISILSRRKQVWESSPCVAICKTEGIRGMFAVEGLCQSSPNRVARGYKRKHEESHLSGVNGVKTQVNNRNFKITALIPSQNNLSLSVSFNSRGLNFHTDYYIFLSGKNSRDYDNLNGPMRHRVVCIL